MRWGWISDRRRACFQNENGRVRAQVGEKPHHAAQPGTRSAKGDFLENIQSGFAAKLAEIEDRGQVNVQGFVPFVWQLAGLRHAALGKKLPAHRPVRKIWKAHDAALAHAGHFPDQKERTMQNLDRVGEDDVIDGLVGIIRQSFVQIAVVNVE